MAKENVNYLAYLVQTLRSMEQRGLLLVTQGKQGKPNIMTIGWATAGVLWGKPCLIVLVRPSRHSHRLLEESGEFTVNVLPGELAEVAEYCGKCSGRERDKFADCGVTALAAQKVKPPVIEECIIHYECRVLHHNDILPLTLAEEVAASAYPEGDYHRLYYGEIVACYADQEANMQL